LLPKNGNNKFIVKYSPLSTKLNLASTSLLFLATILNEFFVKFRRQSQNKLNMFCRKDEISFDVVAKNGINVKATSDFVE